MVGLSYATITPIKLWEQALALNQDKMMWDVRELFEIRNETSDLKCKGNFPMEYKTHNTTIASKKFTKPYASISMSKFITNRTMVVIHDQNQVTLQEVSLDGLNFVNELTWQLLHLGSNPKCDDVVWDSKTNYFYVICRGTDEEIKNTVFVTALDGTKKKENKQFTFKETDDQKCATSLIGKVMELEKDKVIHRRLVIYAQGLSSTKTTFNYWLRPFEIGGTGDKLTDLDYYTMSTEITSFYNAFSYRDQILMSVFTKGQTIINSTTHVWVDCNLNDDQKTVDCDNTPKNTTQDFKLGYAGILNTGQYVEISNDKDSGYIKVCDFLDSFFSPNWIDTKHCFTFGVDQKENVFPHEVEGNRYQLIIRYAHADGSYAGYTHHIFHDIKEVDQDEHKFVVAINKNYYKISETEIDVFWMRRAYFYLEVENVKGNNSVAVECTGDEGKVVNSWKFHHLDSFKKGVTVNDSIKFPQINVFGGSRNMIPIPRYGIQGNALNINIKFTNEEVKNLVTANVIDTAKIEVSFQGGLRPDSIRTAKFTNHFAVVHDISNDKLLLYYCYFTTLRSVLCKPFHVHPISKYDSLNNDVFELFDYTLVMSTDNINLGGTVAHIFHVDVYDEGFDVEHSQVSLGGFIEDITVAEFELNGYIFSTLKQTEEHALNWPVQIYHFDRNTLMNITIVKELTQARSGEEYFCPKQLQINPYHGRELFVVSYCEANENKYDQRIISYILTENHENPDRDIGIRIAETRPINFDHQEIDICHTGEGIVIDSVKEDNSRQIYSVRHTESLSFFSYGIEDWNIGGITKFRCIQEAGMFTTLSSVNGNLLLSVFRGNELYTANERIYKILREKAGIGKTADLQEYNSYMFAGQLIHWFLFKDGNYQAWVSFPKEPIIDLGVADLKANSPQGKQEFVIDYENGGDRQTYKGNITLVKPSGGITITQKKTDNSVKTEEVDLEEYIDIKGPMRRAALEGVSHREVSLTQRHHTYSVYQASEENHNKFQYIETYDQSTIGVHRSPDNYTIFSFFQNISEFKGVHMQQSDEQGVATMSFVTHQKKENMTLVAFSTAGRGTPELEVMLFMNNERLALTHTDGHEHLGTGSNYTKVKVVKMTKENEFVILGHSHLGWFLDVIRAQVSETGGNWKITLSKLETLTNVHHFTYAHYNNDTIHVVYTEESDPLSILYHDIENKKDTEKFVVGPKKTLITMPEILRRLGAPSPSELASFWIVSIEARHQKNEGYYLLLDTLSTSIFEISYSDPASAKIEIFSYEKLPSFDAHRIEGNDKYFAMEMYDQHSNEFRLVSWRRQSEGGSNLIWYTQEIDGFTPFTVTTCKHGGNHLTVATPSQSAPMIFEVMGTLKLQVKDSDIDLKAIQLAIESTSPSTEGSSMAEYKINQIWDGPDDDDVKKAFPWWPFVLVLAVLIAIGLGFLFWKKKTEGPMDDPDKYVSIKPEEKKSGATEDEV